jgi:thiamine biosynthesis lipoprotein
MGGSFSIALYSADRSEADAAAEAAFGELRRLDSMLSNYRPDSEWSATNRDAAKRPAEVSQELFDLISACLEYSRLSEGAFDITVGSLMRAWGFVGGHGKLPDAEVIQEALNHVGYRHIVLDPLSRTVKFARARLEMDPGGIGKGYAVDRMISELKRRHVDRALVSAAGSTIYALGVPPGREGWPVNISLSGMPDLAAGRLMLRDEALSTSGNSEKFLRIGGRIYGHILDPRTGYPVRGVLLAAVRAPSAIDSEAWTKAVFVNGRNWAARHVPAGFSVFFCEEEAPCAWIP